MNWLPTRSSCCWEFRMGSNDQRSFSSKPTHPFYMEEFRLCANSSWTYVVPVCPSMHTLILRSSLLYLPVFPSIIRYSWTYLLFSCWLLVLYSSHHYCCTCHQWQAYASCKTFANNLPLWHWWQLRHPNSFLPLWHQCQRRDMLPLSYCNKFRRH